MFADPDTFTTDREKPLDIPGNQKFHASPSPQSFPWRIHEESNSEPRECSYLEATRTHVHTHTHMHTHACLVWGI